VARGAREEPADPNCSRPSHHQAALAAVVALIGIPAAGGPPDVRCSLTDERISESSGIAASSSSDEVVFTHNDSGDRARFFAVDAATCATRATYEVTGATNLDWEDMAAGVAADGTPVLWLADIGDNQARRASVVVYEVNEPAAAAPSGAIRTRSRRTLTYPDGPQDAETLIVDPESGRPVIVTKDGQDGVSRVYRLPVASGPLERLADLKVRALPGGGLTSAAWSLTSGATSPDRRTVVLRSYLAAWLWTIAPGEPLATTLARPPESLTLPLGRQAEALTFTRDGTGVWVTSEGTGTPLARVPLTPPESAPPADAGSASSPDPRSVPADRPLVRRLLAPAVSIAGVAVLILAVILVFRRRRSRRTHR